MITNPDSKDDIIFGIQRESEGHRSARLILATDLVALANGREVVTALASAVESRMKAGELALQACSAFIEKWNRQGFNENMQLEKFDVVARMCEAAINARGGHEP